jgi:hypothetical protein
MKYKERGAMRQHRGEEREGEDDVIISWVACLTEAYPGIPFPCSKVLERFRDISSRS